MTVTFEMPPVRTTEAGATRRVGVELEFGGLTCMSAAKIVRELFGGEVQRRHRYSCLVENTALGTFGVELDTKLANPKTWRPSEQWRPVLETVLGLDWESEVSELTGGLAELVLPTEITTPPVALDRLDELEALPRRLGQERAEGTADGWLYAFGLHLNAEMPALDPATVLSYLRAYMVLSEWLRTATDMNLKRRLLAFADPFPERYVLKVTAPDYAPNAAALIDDYVGDNPTRNRGLDLLPVLAMIDEARVRRHLPHETIRKRPALHYRLPDCRLRDPGWSIGVEWNRWIAVERLAADKDRLAELAARMHGELSASWLDRMARWIG